MTSYRLLIAFALAIEAHDEQTRKGTTIPYLSHPLGVASLVMGDGGSIDETSAALLHDAVEDGGEVYVDRIRKALGEEVLQVVLECSDSVVPAGVEKPPWKDRKDAYLASIPHKSASAILVTTADKLHNARAIAADLRDVGPSVFERFSAGRDGTLWYYDAVSEDLARHPDARPRLISELRREMAAECTPLATADPASRGGGSDLLRW